MANSDAPVAVVTGSSRGAGRGVAIGLGQRGYTVYVTGRTTQAGTNPLPGTIYEAAEAVTKAGGRGIPVRVFARPHEMFIARQPEEGMDYIPATVIHLNPTGSLVKIEMQRGNGSILQAEIPKHIVDALNIAKGEAVFVRPKNVRVFE